MVQPHGECTGLSRRQQVVNTRFFRLRYLLGRRWKHSKCISSSKAGEK
jgi:hypothetical protein